MKASDWKSLWLEDGGTYLPFGIKKLSILHNFPYWDNLLINHLLYPCTSSKMWGVQYGIISLERRIVDLHMKALGKWRSWKDISQEYMEIGGLNCLRPLGSLPERNRNE